MSRPTRARGLKQLNLFEESQGHIFVAPHAGAWIETIYKWINH